MDLSFVRILSRIDRQKLFFFATSTLVCTAIAHSQSEMYKIISSCLTRCQCGGKRDRNVDGFVKERVPDKVSNFNVSAFVVTL